MENKTEKYYQEILSFLKANQGPPGKHGLNYGGNQDPKLHISMPKMRKLAKSFIKNNPKIKQEEFVALLDKLYQGKYDDEKQFASKLLFYTPALRNKITPRKVDFWLNFLNGWSQVDSLTQSVFSPEDFLDNWPVWKKLIKKLSVYKNINKRRASLVLLTGPVRRSKNEQFAQLSFMVIDQLKKEKDPLITKAVSWLLRTLIKHHRKKVVDYLKRNQQSLPAVALRETKRKLKTGKK